MYLQAAVFSYKLTVAGVDYTKFGSPKYSFAVDGYGISGVCAKSFDVSIPADIFSGAGDNAEVQLTCTNNAALKFPKMYISNRGVSETAAMLRCSDRMMFVNQMISISSTSFTNKKIAITTVLNHIAEQCGFSSWSATNSSGINAIGTLYKDQVYKRQCSDILSMIATACCGYWFCDDSTGSERLIFKAFGSGSYSGASADKHTKIVVGGTKGPLSHLIMQNGEEVYESGSSSSMHATIKINTPLASNDIVGIVEECFDNYTYQAWSCNKARINSVPGFACLINFAGDTARECNYGSYIPTATGVYFSGGSNDVSEDEFDFVGKHATDINNRIAFGNRFGRGQINADGKLILYTDKNA